MNTDPDTEILDCGHPPTPTAGPGTGYGTDKDGKRHCYVCCAEQDKARMIETGRATLYLISPAIGRKPWYSDSREDNRITNWPGTLSFRTGHIRKGRHNFAGTRYDAWFTGPDGKTWHAVQYGENTQIAHCKRRWGQRQTVHRLNSEARRT